MKESGLAGTGQANPGRSLVQEAVGILALPVQVETVRAVFEDGHPPAAFVELNDKTLDELGLAAPRAADNAEDLHGRGSIPTIFHSRRGGVLSRPTFPETPTFAPLVSPRGARGG